MTVQEWGQVSRYSEWGREKDRRLLNLYHDNQFRKYSDEIDRFVAILPLACHNRSLGGFVFDIRMTLNKTYERIRRRVEAADSVQNDSYHRIEYLVDRVEGDSEDSEDSDSEVD